MSPSSLAGHVIELLEEVVKSDLPADRVIADFYKDRRYLGSHDRRWISNRVYGIIRNYILLQEVVKSCAPRQDALYTFLVYEVLLAKMQTDEMEGGYSKLLETYRLAGIKIDLEILQGCAVRKYEEMEGATESMFVLNSFPDFFGDLLPESVRDDALPIMVGLNREARTCIRVETNKISRDEVVAFFKKEGVAAAVGDFSPMAVYLPRRLNLNNVQFFRDGLIEIQDESSQIVGWTVDPKEGETIVDACAGGGGKSLEFAALSKGRARIYALDIEQSRLESCAARARKAGYENITTIRVSPDNLDGVENLVGTADKVVVDAPCTGSGTIRRNPDKKFRMTKFLVQSQAAYQKELLERYSKLVKVGGTVFYVTCSIFAEENESVVNSFIGSNQNYQILNVAELVKDPKLARLAETGFLAIYPHRHEMDGFFMAALRRVS